MTTTGKSPRLVQEVVNEITHVEFFLGRRLFLVLEP
jgi:hypothetical protein